MVLASKPFFASQFFLCLRPSSSDQTLEVETPLQEHQPNSTQTADRDTPMADPTPSTSQREELIKIHLDEDNDSTGEERESSTDSEVSDA